MRTTWNRARASTDWMSDAVRPMNVLWPVATTVPSVSPRATVDDIFTSAPGFIFTWMGKSTQKHMSMSLGTGRETTHRRGGTRRQALPRQRRLVHVDDACVDDAVGGHGGPRAEADEVAGHERRRVDDNELPYKTTENASVYICESSSVGGEVLWAHRRASRWRSPSATPSAPPPRLQLWPPRSS